MPVWTRADRELLAFVAEHAAHRVTLIERDGIHAGLDCDCGAAWLPLEMPGTFRHLLTRVQ